jgi:hypothetical protein
MIAVMAYCVMAMPMIAALAFWTPGNFGLLSYAISFANTIPRHSVGPQEYVLDHRTCPEWSGIT